MQRQGASLTRVPLIPKSENDALIPLTALQGQMHWLKWNRLKLWMLRGDCGCIINICALVKLEESVSRWASLGGPAHPLSSSLT